jgi:translation initiation factor IF-1
LPKQKEIIGDYEEIEDADFFKFENIGDSIEGNLIDIGTSEQYHFGLYTLEKDDGTTVRFHGAAQLDGKMKSIKLGDSVKVEFYDVEKRAKGNMKLFRVMRKRN